MLWNFNRRRPERGPCGHSYPEVVRVKDDYSDGKSFRTFDCIQCGRYEFEIPGFAYSRRIISDEEIREARKGSKKLG